MGKVSFNLKAKKKSDADGMLLHCCDLDSRMKSENIIFQDRTKYNVTTPDLYLKYLKATKRVEEIKKKAIQKNANHYLEGVLSFSSADSKMPTTFEEFIKQAPDLISQYGKEIADNFGFEYIGFSLHLDEGSKLEDGRVKLNVHAHISFINFDFKTNKARFREYQQKYTSNKKAPNPHFVKMQDMAGDVFSALGFERGVSKQITKRKHLEKEEYKVIAKLKEEQNKIRAENKALVVEKVRLQSELDRLRSQHLRPQPAPAQAQAQQARQAQQVQSAPAQAQARQAQQVQSAPAQAQARQAQQVQSAQAQAENRGMDKEENSGVIEKVRQKLRF